MSGIPQAIGHSLPCSDLASARLTCRRWAQLLLATLDLVRFNVDSVDVARAVAFLAWLTGPTAVVITLPAPPSADHAAWQRGVLKQLLEAAPGSPSQGLQVCLLLDADVEGEAEVADLAAAVEVARQHCSRPLEVNFELFDRRWVQRSSTAASIFSAALPALQACAQLRHLGTMLRHVQVPLLQPLTSLTSLGLDIKHRPLLPGGLQAALGALAGLTGLRSLQLPFVVSEAGEEVRVPFLPQLTQLLLVPPDLDEAVNGSLDGSLLLAPEYSSTLQELQTCCGKVQVGGVLAGVTLGCLGCKCLVGTHCTLSPPHPMIPVTTSPTQQAPTYRTHQRHSNA